MESPAANRPSSVARGEPAAVRSPSGTPRDPADAPGPLAIPAIDASCRWPVLFLFLKAAGWLVVAGVLAFVASLKFHAPSLLADCPWLTYGRVHPAALHALVYGFAAQAGLGVALWLLCRLGRTALVGGGFVIMGTALWNLGTLLGVGGILAGASTGFPWLELPRFAAPALFLGYLLVGVCGLLTFHQRRERTLYVSQWFLLAALFWFPWIYSTATLLLVVAPVRGVVQVSAHGWYVHNLHTLWLGFLGLGALFYFIPKLVGRPLYSQPLAIFSFWGLAWFGSWGGLHADAPLPAWLPAVSTFFTVLSGVFVLGVGVNFWKTLATDAGAGSGGPSKRAAPRLLQASFPPAAARFVGLAGAAYVIGGLLAAIASHRAVNSLVHFTVFESGRTLLWLYGFFAMAMFGAIYHIVPRLMSAGEGQGTRRAAPGAQNTARGSALDARYGALANAHFWCSAAGVVISVLALTLGGVVQGLKLNDAGVGFMDVLKTALMFYRLSTLGELLILGGHLLLAVNLGRLVVRWCAGACLPACAQWLAVKPLPAEAKA